MITAAKTGGASSDGVPQVIRKILRDEGLNALFAGLMPSFVLTLNPAIQYLVYDRYTTHHQRAFAVCDVAYPSCGIVD